MGWWANRKRRARERAQYELAINNVPAGFPLLCGRVVGVDVPHDQVREHIERDCKARTPGGISCVEMRRR